MKKKKILLTILVIAFLATWYVSKFYFKPGQIQPDAAWVEARAVKEATVPVEVNAIGTLVARSVEVTPSVAGHVEKIFVQDGAFVKQGTPLFQLDDAIYKAKLASAKAKLIYSENDFKRMTFLGSKGAIAKQAIDQAESNLKERRADVQEMEVMLNKLKLVAPFDGVVGKSKVNPGDYVTIGQSMVTLTDTKHLHIDYNVAEKYLPLLKLGQEVSIKTAAYPGKTFLGKLAFISPTVSPDHRTLSLYAELPNDSQMLAAGMFVNVTQSLGSEQKVLMIPARSLVPILDGEQVYKVMDGKAYAVTVTIGKREGNNVQVVQGLKVGDIIITDGQLKIKNGSAVQVKS